MRFLLDTNVLSEPAKPEPNPGVMERLRRHGGEVCTAALVWNELWFGCRRLPHSKRRRILSRYLAEHLEPSLLILPYDAAAARWHAGERARLGRVGRTPAFVDGQIAAVAQVNGLTLVTGNVSDYRVFEGLEIVDWTAE